MAIKWTEEKINELKELSKTKTLREVAELVQESYSSVEKIAYKNKIKFVPIKPQIWTEEKIEKIRELAKIKTCRKVAEELNSTCDAISKVASKNGIKFTSAINSEPIEGEEQITRDHFDSIKTNKHNKKRYFVTAAVAGAELDKQAFETIQFFCKDVWAELVILPMRGCFKNDEGFSKELLALADHFTTEFVFNKNLIAKDFLINPQQINPLTGLARYGQKNFSLIIASPKVQMQVVPVSNCKMPHILHSTGVITKPNYRHDRIGKIAYQDHTLGGLLVEIENQEIYHLRQISLDEHYGVYDLGTYYQGETKVKKNASAFIMGDLHAGFEEKSAIKCWKECIGIIEPEYIVMHDVFDARSISHHEDHNLKAQVNRPKHLDTLEKELNNLVNTLEDWIKTTKSKIVIVKSNHDAFLDRYLSEGRYVSDRFNHRLALELAIEHIDGKNPLEQYCLKHSKLINLDRVKWLERDEDFKIAGIQLGSHGDLGMNGARGTPNQMETSYGKSVTAHTHTPMIFRNTRVVGTSAINLGYNIGPSSWLLQSGIVYYNGQYQSINSINGRFKI